LTYIQICIFQYAGYAASNARRRSHGIGVACGVGACIDMYVRALRLGQATTMSVLKVFEKSGDAHIGQTLARLARLAQAAHEYERAMQQARPAMHDSSHDHADETMMARLKERLP